VLFSSNQIFYPVVFNGVIMAGGIFSGCNPTYNARELAHQIRDCDPKFVLCQRGQALTIGLEAGGLVGLGHQVRTYVFDDGVIESPSQPDEQGCPYWSALIASDAEGDRFAWDPLTGPNEAAERTLALNYSSGTTGLSKGVEITHRNYVANVVQYNFNLDVDEKGQVSRRRHEERYLCFLPLYHAMGQVLFIGVAQLRQVPTYIMEKFDFVTFLKNVAKYRITHLTLVPPVMVALAKSPETKKFDLSSVEKVGSGAAPLGRKVIEEVESLWPKGVINVKQGYGMTE
jgi:acyl-CoA synthetase (AMP-forming)/AMP-acid ligase II